ncbi:MAG TPA: TetR/AcrR family transcriptional regulator [Clostridiaceae bacterium]|nr:TetR/AcrR family transcriptional regulator [Clostridiaceae bacterium]
MKSDKLDRRAKYTRMVLKESLINLLEKKDISKITIKEICDDADINRATFYSHYNDQYDLLRKIEDELLNNVSDYIEALYKADNSRDDVSLVEEIFEYIKQNGKLCRLLLNERGDLNFQKKVMMLVYDRIVNELTDNNNITKEDAECIYSFFITGCVGLVQKWLNDGMKKSARYMAEMVMKLTLGITSSYKTLQPKKRV